MGDVVLGRITLRWDEQTDDSLRLDLIEQSRFEIDSIMSLRDSQVVHTNDT